jgi:hypothetical protein
MANQKTITIGYCDGAEYIIEYFQHVFPLILKKKYPEFDYQIYWVFNPQTTPNILIYSIFSDFHKRLDCYKICICGEPNNISDQTPNVLIDCKKNVKLRNPNVQFQFLPFYVLSFVERVKHSPRDLIKLPTFNPREILSQKKHFCAFLYSNNIPFRNELFHFISTYKQVDSLGKCCNCNPHVETDRRTYDKTRGTYNDLAIEKYIPYKFVICCENSVEHGYITEKIVNAMLANCIPIYFGTSAITQHFNTKSFINVSDYNTLDEIIHVIKTLDENDDMYCEMLQRSWLHGNTLSHYFDDYYCQDVINI